MKKWLTAVFASGAFLGLCGSLPLFSQSPLESYLEIELKRIEETYRLLDQFAGSIWPGWKNYPEIQFRVQYPNLVFLLLGPRGAVPAGYEAVPGRTLRGKAVYLNRKEELPIKLQPPLIGGGGGGMSIRIMLQQSKILPEDAARAIEKNKTEKNPGFQPPCSSEGEILLYVHEFFHGFQEGVAENVRKAEEKRKKEGQIADKAPKTEIEEERDFEVNPEYSVYSHIEGQALLDAFREKDKAKALESFKDYSVAREIKHSRTMTPGAVAFETNTTLMEGTASYSDAKMAMLIREKKYRPIMRLADDPFFFDFRFVDGYAYEKTVRSMEEIMGETLDTLGKCYTFGLFQCLLLDRFFPGWKKDVFESGLNLDQITASKLRLSEKEKTAAAERLKTKYRYDELYAKHAPVIKNRDEVRSLVTARKGKTYVVDFQRTREFIIPEGRGRYVVIGVKGYYLNGLKEFTTGDVVLTTWDIPIHKPFIYSVEWTDTEAKPGDKGYVFYYEKKIGEIYKNVFFSTPGFTLKAPEIEIKEDKEKNEFRIFILSKVAR